MDIRPLCWGDARAFYQNATRSVEMLADLFQMCIVNFDGSAKQVAALPAGRASLLERAILEASELDEEEDGVEGESPTPNPTLEDEEPAEHSVMAGPAANDRATDQLDEYTEADLVYQLHQQGYTFLDSCRLLIPEIELLMEGVKRSNKRQERERENADSPDAQSQPEDMQGNRGATHGDHLW